MRLGSFLRAGAGTVVSQAIAFAALPFMFRLYQPSDFAPWATILAIVTLVGGLATLRYDLAIVVERDPLDASALFWLSLLLALTVGLGGSVVIALGAVQRWVVAGVDIAAFGPSIAAWLSLVAINQALLGWALHRGAFLDISLAQISNAVVLNGVQLAGGIAGRGSQALVVGSAVGQVALLAVLTCSVLRRPPAPASFRACRDRIRSLARRHRRFPLFSAPYSFFSNVRDRASVIVLGIWAGATDVGLYSQTWRLMSVPVGLSGATVRPVVFHASAEQGLAVQERRINRILLVLLAFGAPWVGILAFRPSNLFALVLGSRWREAGPLAAAMGIPFLLFVMTNWMDRLLDVANRQDLNLLTESVSAITSTAVLALALAAGWPLLSAVAAQCVVLTLNYAVLTVVAYSVAGYRRRALARLAVLGVVIAGGFAIAQRLLSAVASYTTGLAITALAATMLGTAATWRLWRGQA